jgi:TIR domain
MPGAVRTLPSAFVSYSHKDDQFVLALVERLQAQGLEIRYDRVALHVGDSLTRALTHEITNGDFLIAVVSPDSVESEWCQTEVALAMNQGIGQRLPKVLPVRFGSVEMPPMLQDTVWVDADRENQETVARRLAAAMRAHLEGREGDAARDAEQAEPATGAPAHEEVVGDVVVAKIDEVAERAWDVFAAAEGVWRGGNVADISDPQRRLRWALDALPDQVRAALSLVERLSESQWEEFFGYTDLLAERERDVRDELRSVRTQVAQGLPVTRRWTIEADLGKVSAGRRDAVSYLWQIKRGEETRLVQVFISSTAIASENEFLPHEVAQAKETNGRSVVVTLLTLDDPPEQPSVTTAGISDTLPD